MTAKTIQLTSQQQAFIDALLGTKRHLALVARAGTGKTSTILEAVGAYHRAFPRHEVMICAFNKAIADEVKDKLKVAGYDWRAVQAGTVHSMGYGLVRFVFKSKVDDHKVRNLIRARNEIIFQVYGAQIADLVGYAKQEAFGFFANIGDAHEWYKLAEHYDVNGLDDTSEMDKVVEAAQQIYRASLDQTDVVDFNDMILFPLIKNLRVGFPKDLLIVDEAQDLSRARQALARKFIKPTGRMVIVGDPRQAIMQFSGADAEAMPRMVKALDALELPLTMTWRCPKSVVREAQRIVPDIVASDSAVEGEVRHDTQLPDDLAVGDAILCRNTAPLITLAYSLIRKGKACKVEGRAIGEGLLRLVNRWKVATTDQLIEKLEVYRDREVQKALARDNEAKAEEVTDRVATLMEIVAAVNAKGKTSVADVRQLIDEMFADGATNVIILATYHRSKGREWNRVFLWEPWRCPSKWARQEYQKEAEANLLYVAQTRAKRVLSYVDPE